MPSSNTWVPRGVRETMFNSLPADSDEEWSSTVPAGCTRLALEVYNNGLDVNITAVLIFPYNHGVKSFNSYNQISSHAATVGSGGVWWVSAGGNAASNNRFPLDLLTPGQTVRIYIAMSGSPTTGTLSVIGHWS